MNELPSSNLEKAFSRCESKYKSQELSNSIYGISLLDAPWNNLEAETRLAIYKAFKRLYKIMTVQVRIKLLLYI